jgi:hypothetical protein
LFLGKVVLSSDCAAAISETINWAHDGGLGVRPANLQTTNLGVRSSNLFGRQGRKSDLHDVGIYFWRRTRTTVLNTFARISAHSGDDP